MNQQGNNSQMLRKGTILRGIYRIDSYLSSGGFGNTYVATNMEFDERVAIKEFFMKGVTQREDNQSIVSVSNTENANCFLEQKEKFKKEARRIRQLRNDHIVAVHDLFEENGTAYYVMDYVDGENLSERLKRTGKPMSEQEVRDIFPQILEALKTIHDANMWHLDLKPANIMVDKRGRIKLIDFGASKQLNTHKGGATTSTAVSYTNGYAPREQMEQNYDKFGPWTDIYALGATLYCLLTNKRPPLPTDIDDDESEDKHIALPFPASVSYEMKLLILSMMRTNRLKRPQSIASITEVCNKSWKEPDEATITQQSVKKDTIAVGNHEDTILDIFQEEEEEKKEIIEEEDSSNKYIWYIGGVSLVILILVIFFNNCGGEKKAAQEAEVAEVEEAEVEEAVENVIDSAAVWAIIGDTTGIDTDVDAMFQAVADSLAAAAADEYIMAEYPPVD